jgi:hypothetical protein
VDIDSELWGLINTVFGELDHVPDLPQVWHYAALLSLTRDDESMKERMLSKWVPDQDGNAFRDCDELRTRLLRQESLSEGLASRLEKVDVHEYARLTLVWRFNSFGHHTDTNALCMYDVTSMMAHSCGASGVWHFGSGDSFCLRARVALREGDEITISYLADEDLLKSVPIRRQKSQGWLFSCDCVRCDLGGNVDPSRGFRCPTCVIGTVFVSPYNCVSACASCATRLSNDVLASYLELEPLYTERVNCIDKEDTEDILAVLKEAVNLFSDSHWVIYMLESMIGENLKNTSPANPSRIDILHRRLSYLKSTFPMPTYTVAWLLEETGDWYLSQGSRPMAASYFERAYWTLRIMCGQDHPFTENVQSKWDSILVDSKESDSVETPHISYA